ncbi:hypothetical protein BDV96DRAFT_498799 [Lophiotrema nucula]|uniref:PARP-type domain-containing protein n=1 Tax=Lophiotrema nucula TaxID=690887 RepID=A0A6A5Z008_9PLEO|nr:hypothetical protein BDV96DRAFT_498799 [Lophiotrema nucula]
MFAAEIASQGRAGCKSKECKDAAVKIAKGELRFGTLITIQDHTSWTWKHWGCVTPVQIANLQDESGGDTEMVDGFDELDEDSQQKVRYALKNGHVPDEDWKGDVEVNRPGQKGFRVKIATPKKKKAKAATPDDVDDEDKPKKKRGRPAKAADDEAAPAAKKPRAKKAKKVKDEDEDTEPEVIPTKKARGKVVKKEEEDVEVEPAAKKPKVKVRLQQDL